MIQKYPKRLIEVDLPIKRISAHARREKSIRHGHISTLHIWWARRPLAACRAVICASLWPDPADPLCPQDFRDKASEIIFNFALAAVNQKELGESCDHETWIKWQALAKRGGLESRKEAHWNILRFALLDFIADFANWDNATIQQYLDTSRALTQAAHEALGGEPGTRPLVVDPFAGGGSIPLEALRVGADAFASDLNPIPVLLNKVALEYIPRYGQRLADEVRKWGDWIRSEAATRLSQFYPKDTDGSVPIAYLWARTIQCEGPGCGAEIPLLRSLWLAKKANRSVALRLVPSQVTKRIDFQIIVRERAGWVDQSNPQIKIENPLFNGTVKRGSVTCPCCGYTTAVTQVREQLRVRAGGTLDARLFTVVTAAVNSEGRSFRLPNEMDADSFKAASEELRSCKSAEHSGLSFIPNESTEKYHSFVNRGPIYGMLTWESYYNARQSLVLGTLAALVRDFSPAKVSETEAGLAEAVKTVLGIAVSRLADICNAFCMWETSKTQVRHLFTKQAIPMMWDFAETCVFSGAAGDFGTTVGSMARFLEGQVSVTTVGHAEQASACSNPLPTDSVSAMVTDPPYYYSVQYADVSDFFYGWLRRSLGSIHPELLTAEETPKDDEIIVQSPGHQFAASGKNNAHYESHMRQAMAEGRRVVAPDGLGVVVFAHTSTVGWETLLQAMIDAGWTVTGSWPIDTELANRLISLGRSVLASSVHLVCRPRMSGTGLTGIEDIGDWREVLQELPLRIHEWMPRLASEGVVGADAIFACLGPALEVFSRYSRVEKANGSAVGLSEYLEHVWAAVSKEALAMVFAGADATGFEADARLTAMWLWTLNAPDSSASIENGDDEDSDEEEADRKGKLAGFKLEYDAARKIAQGLGADLENLTHLVQVSGDQARLLPVNAVPAARVAAFVGTEFDLIAGRGGADGTPIRKTPWGEIAFQLGGASALAVLVEHEKQAVAPGGDVIRAFLPKDRPVLILMDELMNFVSRSRKSGMAGQLYSFLHNLSEEARGRDNMVLAVSVPASELEMSAEDQSDYERFKKLLDRVGKAVIMSAESETSEIIRRRLFEWDENAVTADGRVLLNRDAIGTCNEFGDWVKDHKQQVPEQFNFDGAREAFAATYPFHPSVLSVFERKWQGLPRFQQTRGILRLLALWVSHAFQDGFKGDHRDPLIGLGTAPLDDPQFRAAMFEQLGEHRLEAAVTTDICGKKDSHAVRLDNEAVDAIKKSRLHRKVATTIFFESNGGMARAEATAPEIRLAVAEPDLDIGHVETVLDALTDACYYLTVERNRYHFSFKENLNKRYADRRANIKDDTISERVRAEVQTVFATNNGIAPVFFPENSGKVPDKPALTFVVLAPEQSMEDEKRVKAFIDGVIREHGSSSRTYKSGLVFVAVNSASPLYESARRVLAWEEIEKELPGISVDKTQITQLDDNIKKSRRDLKESVWRSYNNVGLLGKNNEVRFIDLGNMHSSAAASIIQFIVNELMHVDEIQSGIGPNLLVRNWPPAIPEWNTKAVRDAFFASPLFPRLLNADSVKETIARGVSNGQLAYVGKIGSGKYRPFNFKRSITALDVEISEEMYIITKENAEAYEQAASQPPTPTEAPTPALFPADSFSGNLPRPSSEQPTASPKPTGVPSGPEPTQLTLGLTWSGDVPSQKWMNFYTKVITKLGVGHDLSLNVKVKCNPQGGVSKQKIEEIKSALRELGLDDNLGD